MDVSTRETKRWQEVNVECDSFYLIYRQRDGGWGRCCCGSVIGFCSWQPSWLLAGPAGSPDCPGPLTSPSWRSDCWQGWRERTGTGQVHYYFFLQIQVTHSIHISSIIVLIFKLKMANEANKMKVEKKTNPLLIHTTKWPGICCYHWIYWTSILQHLSN